MSDLLSIGASGVRAYQSALSTTSENIANSGTAGYVRRSATIANVNATGMDRGSGGLGSIVTGIARAGDMFRAAEVRSSGTALARSEAGIVWMDRIEGALSGAKIGERLAGFYNAATTLAADPTSLAARAVMVESAGGVAQAFTAAIDSLDRGAADLNATAAQAATTLTSLGRGLAEVNVSLARALPDSAARAQLLDQRDRLLDEMGALTDISVTFDAIGRASVRNGGATGSLLVHGDTAATVGFARNDEGAMVFETRRDGVSGTLSATGGAIAGMVEGAQRISDARTDLAAVAKQFADGVNGVQANGRDLDAQPGADLFAIDAAGRMSANAIDPRAIAAAAVGGGVRDNTNLTELARFRSDEATEGKVTGLIAGNASALAGRRIVAQAQGAIRDGAVGALGTQTGVDLDQEAVDLMRFQQAYQASSRVIQVARDTIQSILDIR